VKGNPRTSSFDRRSRSVVAAILVAAGILAPPFVLSSCGVKPPEIASVEWRIESRPRPEGSKADNSLNMYESLSVFGSIKDDAGLDNISELWIVHDASCLAWKLTDADWTKTSSGEDIWIGTSALATPELGSLPRGDYRMIAIDAAGARAELGFTVAGEFPEKTPPRIAYGNGTLSVHSDWPETLALAFDEAGALITSVAAPTAASSLSDEFGKDIALRTTEIGAYGYDPTLQMGSFSRRITTR
jgi:hypothetical protein